MYACITSSRVFPRFGVECSFFIVLLSRLSARIIILHTKLLLLLQALFTTAAVLSVLAFSFLATLLSELVDYVIPWFPNHFGCHR